MNFYGASKGNLGAAGFGGIFWDLVGTPLQVLFGSIGWDSNNSADLEGLWKGLCLAEAHNYFPLQVEGYSQILVNATTHILMGASTSKVAKSWRLSASFEHIEQWINHHRDVSFKHVKCSGNKIVDLLANKGVYYVDTLFSGPLENINDTSLL